MSLVNHFEITLKDFFPDRSAGMIIRNVRSTLAMISDRLYAKLNDYADANQLPLSQLVEQLREEIHPS